MKSCPIQKTCFAKYNPSALLRDTVFRFLGSVLPQFMALSVSQLVTFVKKKYVCPFVGLHCIVGASPLCENMCVHSLGYIVGASPPL